MACWLTKRCWTRASPQQETYYKVSIRGRDSIHVLIVDSTGIRTALAVAEILLKSMTAVSRRAG